MNRLIWDTESRISAVEQQVKRIALGPFPQKGSKALLDFIQERLNFCREQLAASSADRLPKTCHAILLYLFRLVQLVGTAQRSSNIRLAFELYEPLRDLCCSLISSGTIIVDAPIPEVVISSEWDYSPLYFQPSESLLKLVLLGMPACESENGLLIPLMGHEIGHAFWQRIILFENLPPAPYAWVKSDLFTCLCGVLAENWNLVVSHLPIDRSRYPSPNADDIQNIPHVKARLTALDKIVRRQAEETFCDFLGIRLFPSSYFHAFAYYLAPGYDHGPTKEYTSYPIRIQHMICAANKYRAAAIPRSFLELFAALGAEPKLVFPLTAPLNPIAGTFSSDEECYCHIAEVTVTRFASKLAEAAAQTCLKAKIPKRTASNMQQTRRILKAEVPAFGAHSLGNLLDAAWDIQDGYLRESLRLKGDSELSKQKRVELTLKSSVLRESVLKSLELFAIEKSSGSMRPC